MTVLYIVYTIYILYLRFEISMCNFIFMQNINAINNLMEKLAGLLLFNTLLCDNIIKHFSTKKIIYTSIDKII